MIKRHIVKVIDYSIKHFPVTLLTGPRQVGKTTILTNEYINKGYDYVTLDNAFDKYLAINDPKRFLELHPYPLIIDEVQKATQLFEEIEYIVNEQRRLKGNEAANGMYILSGSSRRHILENAKESLAGRAALIDMSNLSLSEILNRDNVPFVNDLKTLIKRTEDTDFDENKILDYIMKGQMPLIYNDTTIDPRFYFQQYIQLYLEKDVKEIIDIKDESKFYTLLRLVASLTGQQINYDNLSKQVGVTHNTIKEWINAMIKTGIIYLIQPYNENSFTKRLVKTPKIYFFDTGIACNLLGIDDINTLSKSTFKGALFETLVINEIKKTYINDGDITNFYYYRDLKQKEVDLVFIKSGKMNAIEIKFGTSLSTYDASKFKELDETIYEKNDPIIINSSSQISALTKGVYIIPFKAI